MISLINFINEGFVLGDDNWKPRKFKNDLFENINVKDFRWKNEYGFTKYQDKCKEEVKSFAKEYFSNLKEDDCVKELFKISCKKYLENMKFTQSEIDKLYNSYIDTLKNNSWSYFEYYVLHIGWWAFMKWVINKFNSE